MQNTSRLAKKTKNSIVKDSPAANLDKPAGRPNDPTVEGVFRIVIQRNLKDMVDLPEVKVWNVLPKTIQARMLVRIRRFGFFFTHDINESLMRCVLTRRNYLIIYAKERLLKGYAVKLSLAEKLSICCSRVEKNHCVMTIKWRFGEITLIMTKEQVTDWRTRILEAFEGSVLQPEKVNVGVQTNNNSLSCLKKTTSLPKLLDTGNSALYKAKTMPLSQTPRAQTKNPLTLPNQKTKLPIPQLKVQPKKLSASSIQKSKTSALSSNNQTKNVSPLTNARTKTHFFLKNAKPKLQQNPNTISSNNLKPFEKLIEEKKSKIEEAVKSSRISNISISTINSIKSDTTTKNSTHSAASDASSVDYTSTTYTVLKISPQQSKLIKFLPKRNGLRRSWSSSVLDYKCNKLVIDNYFKNPQLVVSRPSIGQIERPLTFVNNGENAWFTLVKRYGFEEKNGSTTKVTEINASPALIASLTPDSVQKARDMFNQRIAQEQAASEDQKGLPWVSSAKVGSLKQSNQCVRYDTNTNSNFFWRRYFFESDV